MNTLRLKDRKYFMKVIKVFSGRSQVSFEVSEECMRISSLESPYIYLSLPDSIYSVKSPTEFTISVPELERGLDLLDGELVLLGSSFRIVSSGGNDSEAISSDSYSFVDIPLSNPIRPHYCILEDSPTRLLMSRLAIRNLLRGCVQYQNSETLAVRRVANEIEECMEVEVDYLSKGYLDFRCSNNWIDAVMPLYEMIQTVLFSFGEGLLSVKLLLRDCRNAYVEIQVRELESQMHHK